jgi:hypothetical protein
LKHISSRIYLSVFLPKIIFYQDNEVKIKEALFAMFWRKKQPAWYWKVLVILIVLRLLYAFARFFMKVVDRSAGKQDVKAPKA